MGWPDLGSRRIDDFTGANSYVQHSNIRVHTGTISVGEFEVEE